MKIIISEAQYQKISESNGDIVLQGNAEQNNISSYQNLFNNSDTQQKIKQADSLGDNVDFKIMGKNNTDDLTISVDGKNGLDNVNDATKRAISNGANLMVNNANLQEKRYTKKKLEELKQNFRKRQAI